MKSLTFLALMAAALPAAHQASAAPVPADPAQRCRDLMPMLGKATAEAPAVAEVTPVGDSGCRYTDLQLSLSRYQGWKVGP
jgi:hypothetical protein